MNLETAARKYIFDDSRGISTNGSTLYIGTDVLMNRRVAIKVIDFRSSSNQSDVLRARNEVAALSQIGDMSLRVPCVLDMHYDETNKKMYIVMQWVNGDTLRKKTDAQKDKPLAMKSSREFVQWMIHLADVLSFMEKRRFYHNDIKPENIIIDKVNELHLIDFNLTISNNTMNEGTPGYIAPEFLSHIEITKDKADMFSIGVMMYEFFAGKIPQMGYEYGINVGFADESCSRAEWDVFIEPKQINPDIPDNVNKLIVRLMKRIPSNRFKDYTELKKEFIKIINTLPRR